MDNFKYLSTFNKGGFCIISYTYSKYWNRIDNKIHSIKPFKDIVYVFNGKFHSKSEIINNYNWTLDFIKDIKSWTKSNERDLLLDTLLN